jgi:uncharacterized protein YidB (DUF937 family)
LQEEIVASVFGDLINSVLKGMSGQSGEASGLPAILGQILGNTVLGSAGGLLQQLQKSGLGPQVASWLGNGANLPVSADRAPLSAMSAFASSQRHSAFPSINCSANCPSIYRRRSIR